MRVLLAAALACFIIGLIDVAASAAIATWPDWLMGGLVALVLDMMFGKVTIP